MTEAKEHCPLLGNRQKPGRCKPRFYARASKRAGVSDPGFQTSRTLRIHTSCLNPPCPWSLVKAAVVEGYITPSIGATFKEKEKKHPSFNLLLDTFLIVNKVGALPHAWFTITVQRELVLWIMKPPFYAAFYNLQVGIKNISRT